MLYDIRLVVVLCNTTLTRVINSHNKHVSQLHGFNRFTKTLNV
jgi:hypothetical protein